VIAALRVSGRRAEEINLRAGIAVIGLWLLMFLGDVIAFAKIIQYLIAWWCAARAKMKK
jgi:hypothetical protein